MALIVYKILPDYSKATLLPVDNSFFSKPDKFRCLSMREGWSPQRFFIKDPLRTELADFMNLLPGAFACCGNAHKPSMLSVLEEAGELLEAVIEQSLTDVKILNAMAVYNCLDRAGSVFRTTPDGKAVIQVSKYSFFSERIGDSNLFKIPELARTEVFVLSGRDSPEDEFYSQYHALGCSGLVFNEIWRSG